MLYTGHTSAFISRIFVEIVVTILCNVYGVCCLASGDSFVLCLISRTHYEHDTRLNKTELFFGECCSHTAYTVVHRNDCDYVYHSSLRNAACNCSKVYRIAVILKRSKITKSGKISVFKDVNKA